MNKVNSTYMAALAVVLTLTTISSAHATTSKEADASSAAKVSLIQAVDMLEKDGKSKTVGAEFDIEKNIAIWEVKMLGDNGVLEYKVNATTGAILKIEDEHIRGKLMSFITGITKQDLKNEKMSLAEAVGMAEKKFNGKAIKVEIEHENKSVQYDIFVYTPNVSSTYLLSMSSQIKDLINNPDISIRSIYLVSPPYLNRTDSWNMSPLTKVSVGKINYEDYKSNIEIFELKSGEILYSSSDIDSHEQIEDIKVVYS